MRKSLGIITLLLPLLAACNLPFQTIQPTADILATRVAEGLTNTPLAASPTVPPIATATTKPTALIPSATPTPGPTATVQASSTTASTDPKASLGKPTWTGSFDIPKNWGLESPYDDGHTRVEISNGAMVLTSALADGWLGWWQVSNQKPKNFYLEATLAVKECSGSDLYGLIFRSPDNARGYWFGVTCDGQYNLRAGEGGSLVDLIKTKKGDSIIAGSNQTNRFGIMVRDNKISLFANGKPLEELTDSTFSDQGTFGLFIAGQKTINFSYACTAIAYWVLG
jgi:hypothetical protein